MSSMVVARGTLFRHGREAMSAEVVWSKGNSYEVEVLDPERPAAMGSVVVCYPAASLRAAMARLARLVVEHEARATRELRAEVKARHVAAV